jgi:uncharacterized protein
MNRLAKETSPYLLQHAHNPVDWYPWGDEAIQKAREEDLPILVSIGYSACHWCHVMERESFEDPQTADFMNRHFVNIKIDREERPDLDQIYMDAVQAIAGNGGWPLNVFLTPEAKPFYGGTYFPPVDLHNRPSWKTVLQNISDAFLQKRREIEEQADHLTNHIAGTTFGPTPFSGEDSLKKEDLADIFEQLMKTADPVEGGFGAAPKFPQTFSIRFLLQHYHFTHEPAALQQATLSLDKMIFGGIYDQLGGGFARYSTDRQWLAPHFEKMLYDNALLITALSEAFQITGYAQYRRAIQETLTFVQNELLSPAGGFYSALDADSEGEEGKFYTWQKNEIDQVLGDRSAAFCASYDVTAAGNWEGQNILRLTPVGQDLLHSGPDPVRSGLRQDRDKLLKQRNQRVHPQLDDKILLGWNALMISACCRAFAALGESSYRDQAVKTMGFLEKKMKGDGLYYFHHSFKEVPQTQGTATIPAFLDDYAYLIEAYIQLQEITGETGYLIRAKDLSDWVIAHFSEPETGLFYYTSDLQDDVIVRKTELSDGATPSGNSVMGLNLLYLGIVFDLPAWKERAFRSALSLKDLVGRYPGSFGLWATLLNACTYPLYEIVLSGDYSEAKHREFLGKTVPNRVFQISSVTHPTLPILRNKPPRGPSQFFLCREYACQPPVKEVAELIGLIKNS